MSGHHTRETAMRHANDTNRTPTPILRSEAVSTGDSASGYLETLEQRLADGYARIEDARSLGQDVTAWEEFWIELLHQYEAVVDDLPEAA